MPHAGHGRSTDSGARGTTTPRNLKALGVCAFALLLLALAIQPLLGRAAVPNDSKPGQRIDLRVLLLSADGTEPGFGAWKAELDREGVPYDTFVAYNGATKQATLTDAQLADYGANRAKYQAVVLASGDLGRNFTNRNSSTSYLSALSDAEWAALDRFERTFGIRRLSDFTAPSPYHGLNVVGGISQDGRTGTLTAAGKTLFPYLKGPIPVADDVPAPNEAFGYEGTPVNPADWQTLVASPTPGAAYLGIYTRPDDGRQEMVMTLGSNQFQSHNQALRHGMLTWVTRGVFLGYQRNYLGLDVDDVFLGDDKWDPAANVTDYTQAIRMTAPDVANAVDWQNRTGLKLNMVYNMGGTEPEQFGHDALFDALRAAKNQFRWTNHTFQHPNLDCTTQAFTEFQLRHNQEQFNALLGPVAAGLNDPSEAVTGEHSGLANTRPGNPGTIDPPGFDSVEAATVTAATLPANTYDYAVTATSAAGETIASITPNVTVTAPANAVIASVTDVCHATGFTLYRRASAGGSWERVATATREAREPVDNGTQLDEVALTDTGASLGAGDPPAGNGATLLPYAQNPGYAPALAATGIHTVASDSSKPYPNPPTKDPVSETDPTNFAKGASFELAAGIRAVPRYPSNVYYNVANRADQLDEYNWIYVKDDPATADVTEGACVDSDVTTCRTTPATWPDYLASETRIMFGHLMGNDPRPHYFHQTNIAQSDLSKPATDITVGGTLYAVIDTLLGRYDQVFDRGSMPLLQLSQQQVGDTLARQDRWAATRASGAVTAWLRDGVLHVANGGAAAVEVPLTGTTVGTPYGGQRSGWTTVAPGTELVLGAPELAKEPKQPQSRPDAKRKASGGEDRGRKGSGRKGKARRLALSRVRMSPRRFAVAHKRHKRGTRLDGATITWRLNRKATVRMKFQRARGKGDRRRWHRVGKITRRARPGSGVVRFRGRFHAKPLKPGRYRVAVSAKRKQHRTVAKRIKFRVVKG